MGTVGKDYSHHNNYHEPLDPRRDTPSVSFTVFVLGAWLHPWLRSAFLHGLNDTDHTRINELYDSFGPIPRICFDYFWNSFELLRHQNLVERTIIRLTPEELRKLVSNSTELNMNDVSHSIFLVKRGNVDDLARGSAEATVGPTSRSVKSGLQNRIRVVKREEQIRLYEYLAPVAGSRKLAGLVLKSLSQQRLRIKVALKLFAMVKRRSNESTDSDEGSKKTPWWHSNHDKKAEGFPGTRTVKRIRTSQWPRSKADSDYHWIKFSSTKTVEYQASELKVISI